MAPMPKPTQTTELVEIVQPDLSTSRVQGSARRHSKPRILDELLDLLKKLVDACVFAVTCGCYGGPNGTFRGSTRIYETELMEGERQAVHNLLDYIENELDDSPSINEERLRALCILTYSDNTDLQRSAALCYAEFSEKMHCPLTAVTIEPLMVLLRSHDNRVQKAASLAVSNFILKGPGSNKDVLLASGVVSPLVQLLTSRDMEIQCNACGCVTTLATSDANKSALVRAGVIRPLLRLVKSCDIRVQRNATGAILNLTHIQSNRNELVARGAIPILIDILHSRDYDVQYYSAAALSNMAVNEKYRVMMVGVGYHDVISRLIKLLMSNDKKVKCQACLALRNLASDADHQLLIVRQHGILALQAIIRENDPETLSAALACLRNLSVHKANERQIVSDEFMVSLSSILRMSTLPEAQQHAAGIIRNLTAGELISDEMCHNYMRTLGEVLMDGSTSILVLIEVTACLAVLADEDDTKEKLINMDGGRIFSRLVSLASLSNNAEVQYNCAGAIGQLSQTDISEELLMTNISGILLYLDKFLSSSDPSFIHVALWTLLQLLDDPNFYSVFKKESRMQRVIQNIVRSQQSEAIQELGDNVQAKMTAQAMTG